MVNTLEKDGIIVLALHCYSAFIFYLMDGVFRCNGGFISSIIMKGIELWIITSKMMVALELMIPSFLKFVSLYRLNQISFRQEAPVEIFFSGIAFFCCFSFFELNNIVLYVIQCATCITLDLFLKPSPLERTPFSISILILLILLFAFLFLDKTTSISWAKVSCRPRNFRILPKIAD